MYSQKRNLMFIHGAWSSCQSFNYLMTLAESELKDHIKKILTFEYNPSKHTMEQISNQASEMLDDEKLPTVIVGHSMGGLIALSISDHENCSSVVTIASPLSGIRIYKLFQPFIYFRAPILAELAPNSKFIKKIQNKKYTKKINCIVTTKGFSPFMQEESDGVVTIKSQESWTPRKASITKIKNGHHEILQSNQTFSVIKKIVINQ